MQILYYSASFEDIEDLGLLEDESKEIAGEEDHKEYNAWAEALGAMGEPYEDPAVCGPCIGSLVMCQVG